jgi:hypothetical protein
LGRCLSVLAGNRHRPEGEYGVPKINIGISVASPLLLVLSLVFMPQLGNKASISFIVSFGAFFFGSFIIPSIYKNKGNDMLRDAYYLGHLKPSAGMKLKQLAKDYHDYIHSSYVIGAIAFGVGILFSAMSLSF